MAFIMGKGDRSKKKKKSNIDARNSGRRYQTTQKRKGDFKWIPRRPGKMCCSPKKMEYKSLGKM